MKWYLHVLKNYANFSGRARRQEYWMFALFNIIFAIVAIVLDNITGLAIDYLYYGPIYIIYMLFVLVPSIAVCVRRLHDINKSGAMFFVSFIPFIGGIWMLVLLVTDGTPGENAYGPSPKHNNNMDAYGDIFIEKN